jgi:hypothetical protein
MTCDSRPRDRLTHSASREVGRGREVCKPEATVA